MRSIMVLLVVLLINSCGTGIISYDKPFYEKVTGIAVPVTFKVLETYDNGEDLTGTTFSTDSLSLLKFVLKYKLNKVKKVRFGDDYPGLIDWGRSYIKGVMPDRNHSENLYFINTSVGKYDWVYVADVKKGILWTLISYPDWEGD
jgi:hypothetical protein